MKYNTPLYPFMYAPTTHTHLINRSTPILVHSKWTNQQLEDAMDIMERGQTSLRKANRLWNIPLTSLSNHLNGKTTTQKMGPACVLIIAKDQIITKWVLAMQNVGLNITLT